MKKTTLFLALFILTLSALSCQNKKRTIKEIDNIVESILDTTRVYDISQSPNFSKNTEQYRVVEYSENDTALLLIETFRNDSNQYNREYYLNHGELIFVRENGMNFYPQESAYKREVWVNEYQSLKAQEMIINTDGSEEKATSFDVNMDDYNTKKALNAINQKGDFELKFGEFLIIEPQIYLILENKESGYNVALFVLEGDFLLDELYTYPEKYKGKTIFVHHEFMNMGGIERMIYRGGIVIEKQSAAN